jgi:hypothetical protein
MKMSGQTSGETAPSTQLYRSPEGPQTQSERYGEDAVNRTRDPQGINKMVVCVEFTG